jgi:flagellar biosynthesis chaperone FliJ
MEASEPERASWLREQLELVDEIRRRLRTEIPLQLTEFEERVRKLEVQISSLRAEYQSEMEDLRLSGAPGEAIGTWEDRYQTAITDLDAIEERLAELKTEVDSASEFARRRYAEAAARIASSGFPQWRTVTCEGDEE